MQPILRDGQLLVTGDRPQHTAGFYEIIRQSNGVELNRGAVAFWVVPPTCRLPPLCRGSKAPSIFLFEQTLGEGLSSTRTGG